ncbi:MAG TPA: hypothetical protein VMU70_01115 [Candidatus Tyrphobacter sp.]|nr:hypothetical protein [Candidatus Tyrphobacter sp.]
MLDERLTDYIRGELKAGANKGDVRRALISKGWLVSDIDEAMMMVEREINDSSLFKNAPSPIIAATNQPPINSLYVQESFFFTRGPILSTIGFVALFGTLIFMNSRTMNFGQALVSSLIYLLPGAAISWLLLSFASKILGARTDALKRSLFVTGELSVLIAILSAASYRLTYTFGANSNFAWLFLVIVIGIVGWAAFEAFLVSQLFRFSIWRSIAAVLVQIITEFIIIALIMVFLMGGLLAGIYHSLHSPLVGDQGGFYSTSTSPSAQIQSTSTPIKVMSGLQQTTTQTKINSSSDIAIESDEFYIDVALSDYMNDYGRYPNSLTDLETKNKINVPYIKDKSMLYYPKTQRLYSYTPTLNDTNYLICVDLSTGRSCFNAFGTTKTP